MADVTFTGGNFGFYGGNQQFTAQRLTFNGCKTAVQVIWDWGWVWKSITVTNADVGFRLVNDDGTGNIGSAAFMDSKFSNVKQGIVIKAPSSNTGTGTTGIVLDNVQFNSVSQAVADTAGNSLLSGVTNVQSWVMGPVYNDTLRTWSNGSSFEQLRELTLSGDINGLPNVPYFERAKPQYAGNAVSDFVHFKDLGAKGMFAPSPTPEEALHSFVLPGLRDSKLVHSSANLNVSQVTVRQTVLPLFSLLSTIMLAR